MPRPPLAKILLEPMRLLMFRGEPTKPKTRMPLWPLKEMTFPATAVVPPIVAPAVSMKTPSPGSPKNRTTPPPNGADVDGPLPIHLPAQAKRPGDPRVEPQLLGLLPRRVCL